MSTINTTGRKIKLSLLYTVLILIGIAMLLPTVVMITSSFKSFEEYYNPQFKFFPAVWEWANYVRVFTNNKYIITWVWNTVLLIVTNTVICTFSTLLVAYGFAKFKCKFNNAFFMLLLSTMMIPWAVTMIPSYMIWANLKLVNSFIPLIIPSIGGSAYYVFLFRQTMKGIPNEIMEAAEIDGANSFARLIKILVPNCIPAITTMVLFTAMGIWGDYLGPLIYLRSEKLFNISLGLNMLRASDTLGGRVDTPMLLAASVLMALPSMSLYFVGTKFFAKGISLQGGVKG